MYGLIFELRTWVTCQPQISFFGCNVSGHASSLVLFVRLNTGCVSVQLYLGVADFRVGFCACVESSVEVVLPGGAFPQPGIAKMFYSRRIEN